MKLLLALFNDSPISQHLIQQIERSSEELYKMKDLYKQKRDGTRKLH